MKKITAIGLLVLFVTAHASAAESSRISSPVDDLMARVNAEGGEKVLAELWANEQTFETLLAPVEAGDSQWFNVWVKLREYSDAAISESIDISFARALPIATEDVLMLIGRGLELNKICGSPFIEPEPGVAEAYERNTLAALAKLDAPKLQLLAKECATHVKLKP